MDEAISIEEGLKRVVNNKKIYQTLLKKFTGRQLIGQIEEALKGNDADSAMKTAHSLKGVAANLAMKPLADVCARMEKAIQDNDSPSALLPEMWEKIAAVEAAMEVILSE